MRWTASNAGAVPLYVLPRDRWLKESGLSRRIFWQKDGKQNKPDSDRREKLWAMEIW